MKIREFFCDSSKWTQGSLARTVDGDNLMRITPEAVSFCLTGALHKCYPEDYMNQLERIRGYLGIKWVTDWNDDPKRTFEDVKELVTRLDI